MIYLYKRGTGMGRLARNLNLTTLLVPENKAINRQNNSVRLNWGCVRLPEILKAGEEDRGKILNYDISAAVSKVRTFEILQEAGIPIPRWDTDGNSLHKVLTKSSREWMLGRKDGLSKGRGIVSIKVSNNTIPLADFYVEKLSCQREFRCHVFGGKVILFQAKVVPLGCKNFIHNFENGCHYTSKNLERWAISDIGDSIESLSIKSVAALGLDFGAVDLILTKKSHLYVLEVNTAPGLRSDAAQLAYSEALKGEMKGVES